MDAGVHCASSPLFCFDGKFQLPMGLPGCTVAVACSISPPAGLMLNKISQLRVDADRMFFVLGFHAKSFSGMGGSDSATKL